MKTNYLASLLLLSTANQVVANESFLSHSQPYWYAGVGIGLGHYDNGGNATAYDSDRDDLAGSVYLGYQINPYLASELGYQYLGEGEANYEQGTVTGDFQQIVLTARLGYPVTSLFYPYAKIGGAYWFGDSDGLRVGSEQGFSPVMGVGFEYAFTPRLTGQIEYQYTDELGDDSIGYTNHHLTSVGLTWRFASLPHSEVPKAAPAPIAEEEIAPPQAEPRQFVYSEQQNESKDWRRLFAHNSSTLANKAALTEVVTYLQQHPDTTAVVTGYTDSVGPEPYNQWLSERRAHAVVTYLHSQGIDITRLTAQGKGELMPIADNTTEEGRAQNRRVEITTSVVSPSTNQ